MALRCAAIVSERLLRLHEPLKHMLYTHLALDTPLRAWHVIKFINAYNASRFEQFRLSLTETVS